MLSLTICQLCHCSTEAATGNPKTPGTFVFQYKFTYKNMWPAMGPPHLPSPGLEGFLEKFRNPCILCPSYFIRLMFQEALQEIKLINFA